MHALNGSCFYKLSSVGKLADLLFISLYALESIANDRNAYNCWDEPKKNGGVRKIEAPSHVLKKIQRRIADLLSRINPPSFLMAPVKKRSYVDNAAVHMRSRAFHLLDIENFFTSCTSRKVFCFFNKRMLCSPDVSALLTKLTTFNGHLPQGSPASPILAYMSYSDVWEKINRIVSSSGGKLTIYADDITISGQNVYLRDIWLVKQALHSCGLRCNIPKQRSAVEKPVEITGIVVCREKILVPNRTHKKISELKKDIKKSNLVWERDILKRRLKGALSQVKQIMCYKGYLHYLH